MTTNDKPADMTEYMLSRRRALIGQAKALAEQRAAILQEVSWITKNVPTQNEDKQGEG